MTDHPSAAPLPSTMKAWRYHSVTGGVENNLQLDDLPLPDISSPNSTLIKVSTVSLNPVDIKFSETPYVGHLLHPYPAIPGCDGVGRVVRTNDSLFKPGQLVAFRKEDNRRDGALAEYVAVPRQGCVAVPQGVSLVEAATVSTCGVTAYQAIVPFLPKDKKVQPRVFINGGSGGTGVFQIQIAKILGCHVTTSCSSKNIDLCKGLGADEVIDYREKPVEETLVQKVKSNKADAFDLVVDNIDHPWQRYKASDAYLAPGGRYVQIGAEVDTQNIKEALRILLTPTILGGGKQKWSFMGVKTNSDDAGRVLGWMGDGRITVPVDSEFTFSQVPDAYRRLKEHRARGKIIVHCE